jgi:hypothetical protein
MVNDLLAEAGADGGAAWAHSMAEVSRARVQTPAATDDKATK